MPIYEYQCETCGHTFEVIQKFSDEPITSCVACSGPVRRLLSPPGLLFKGTGFYATDYQRKKTAKGHKPKGDNARAETEASSDPSGDEQKSKVDTNSSDE